jgi:hypothetical protein
MAGFLQSSLFCAKPAHGMCQEIASIPLEFLEQPGFRVSPEPSVLRSDSPSRSAQALNGLAAEVAEVAQFGRLRPAGLLEDANVGFHQDL